MISKILKTREFLLQFLITKCRTQVLIITKIKKSLNNANTILNQNGGKASYVGSRSCTTGLHTQQRMIHDSSAVRELY
jgi:hypothetical protein